MRVTPKRLDKQRFAPLINLVVGIIVVVIVDSLWKPFALGQAIVKGLLVAAMTGGGYDMLKAGKSIVRNNGGNK